VKAICTKSQIWALCFSQRGSKERLRPWIRSTKNQVGFETPPDSSFHFMKQMAKSLSAYCRNYNLLYTFTIYRRRGVYMRVSAVKVVLTEEDILSIIYDYIDIEGLKIDSIKIKESIVLRGSYKKKITIPFLVKMGLGNIHGNIVSIKVFSVKVSKIGIFSGIKNMTLRKLLSDFSEYGVKVNKDTVTLDLELVSKRVPYFYFKLNTINMIKGALEIEAQEIIYSERKPVYNMDKREKSSVNLKIEDEYSKLRNKVLGKVPDKYDKVILYAMILPDIMALLWRLFRDKRVKTRVKIMVAGVIAYLGSPLDVIPDFIPLVGKIDDVAIAFFALNAILNEVPKEIILQNWQGREDIILITREAVRYISEMVGSRSVGKFLLLVKNILKKGEKEFQCQSNKRLEKKESNNRY